MKIIYTYESYEEQNESLEFNSLSEFLSHRRGKMFRELLSLPRVDVLDKLIIELNYPAVITIEFIKEKQQ